MSRQFTLFVNYGLTLPANALYMKFLMPTITRPHIPSLDASAETSVISIEYPITKYKIKSHDR